jgi:hypothetical protein
MTVRFRSARRQKYEEIHHTLNGVIRKPPLDPLIDSEYLRAGNIVP